MKKRISNLLGMTVVTILAMSAVTFGFSGQCTELVEAIEDQERRQVNDYLNSKELANCVSIGDGTPLIAAARTGNMRLAKRLVDEFGAEVNKSSIGDGSPLIQASARGHLEIIEYLIRSGADVDLEVEGDETALISAARYGRLAAARLLVSNGADVNKSVLVKSFETEELRSPLSMAIKNGHNKLASYLKQNGATK